MGNQPYKITPPPPEFSGWDNFKFTVGGAFVLLLIPVAVVAAIVALIVLL